MKKPGDSAAFDPGGARAASAVTAPVSTITGPRSLIRNLVCAFLVFRLESRLLSVDPGLALLAWLRRPVIEVMLDQLGPRSRLIRKLNEVYPF